VSVVRPAAVVIMLLFCAAPADAAQCTVATTSVNFGSYNVFTPAPTDSTGTVVLDCNGGAHHVRITLGRGGASTFLRYMEKASERLYYNLFKDAARIVIWGDGTGGADDQIVANPPNNMEYRLTIYGRLWALQDVSAGTYTDTVTVTVNY
jgi:spore coat protein U-like protein